MEGYDMTSMHHHFLQVALTISVANTKQENKKEQLISVFGEYENQLNVDDKKLLDQVNNASGPLTIKNIINELKKKPVEEDSRILDWLERPKISKSNIIVWALINPQYNIRQYFHNNLEALKSNSTINSKIYDEDGKLRSKCGFGEQTSKTSSPFVNFKLEMRNWHQKHVLHGHFPLKAIKDKSKIPDQEGLYRCPGWERKNGDKGPCVAGGCVKQLQAAHIGTTRDEIIVQSAAAFGVIDDQTYLNTTGATFEQIRHEIIKRHEALDFNICCNKCNKMCESI